MGGEVQGEQLEGEAERDDGFVHVLAGGRRVDVVQRPPPGVGWSGWRLGMCIHVTSMVGVGQIVVERAWQAKSRPRVPLPVVTARVGDWPNVTTGSPAPQGQGPPPPRLPPATRPSPGPVTGGGTAQVRNPPPCLRLILPSGPFSFLAFLFMLFCFFPSLPFVSFPLPVFQKDSTAPPPSPITNTNSAACRGPTLPQPKII